jgi:hypothetical protein
LNLCLDLLQYAAALPSIILTTNVPSCVAKTIAERDRIRGFLDSHSDFQISLFKYVLGRKINNITGRGAAKGI